ncbi:MAG TPA: lytic transglycosylase domain-containing protein [Nocardioidaceae bacterium]|nr:lytic transglycosylase domain-containing protein [Nocardioidaceae bacterium]
MSPMRTYWAAGVAAVVLTTAPIATSLAQDEVSASYSGNATTLGARVVTVVQPPSAEPVTLLAKQSKRKEKSTRGDRFYEVSATGSNDVPEAALRAYKNAEATLDSSRPGCQLPWTLLAAIGRVESDHGRYGGSVLGSDGISRPAILGLPLNGIGPVAAIHDTDDGKLDGDKVWDRAVGQMQFIPSTWRMVAADGDGDGTESPNDIDDAAEGAGHYLCWGGFSVADTSGMARAIFSYNHSDYYVQLVMAFQRGYETGVFIIPSPPPPPGADDGLPKKKRKGSRDQEGTAQHGTGGKDGGKNSGGSGGSGGHTSQPPTTTNPPPPPPTSEPPPPPTVTLTYETGVLTACETGYCLGAQKLGFGPEDQLAREAAYDYDGDAVLETNGQELAGLVEAGTSVKLGYEVQDGVAVVYVVGDKDYRFADGTFA